MEPIGFSDDRTAKNYNFKIVVKMHEFSRQRRGDSSDNNDDGRHDDNDANAIFARDENDRSSRHVANPKHLSLKEKMKKKSGKKEEKRLIIIFSEHYVASALLKHDYNMLFFTIVLNCVYALRYIIIFIRAFFIQDTEEVTSPGISKTVNCGKQKSRTFS